MPLAILVWNCHLFFAQNDSHMELQTDTAHMHPSAADSLVKVLKKLHSILAQNFQITYYLKWYSVQVLYDFCMHFLTVDCHT
jgi:hypothetical protein